jgi:hypothetical protein
MGNKKNILTLKKNTYKDLSFSNFEKEYYSVMKALKFWSLFESLLKKKGVVITKKSFHFESNKIVLNIEFFITSFKVISYKKKIKSKYFEKKKNNIIKNLFFKKTKLFQNVIFLNFLKINSKINQLNTSLIYTCIGRFSNGLFLRRNFLLMDFLKISTLFCFNNLHSKTLIYYLALVFKMLSKSKHSKFLLLVKELFSFCIKKSLNIQGIKFNINGKIQGKARSSNSLILLGAVPNQSLDKNIEYSRIHVYTIYGAFGFKMWVYRNENKL